MEFSSTDRPPSLKGQDGTAPNEADNSTYEKNRVRISGALNALGDAGLLADGIRSKSIPVIIAGSFYTAGAAVAMLFGTANKKHQVQDLTERAAEFIQTHSSEHATDTESAEILKHRDTGIIASTTRALRRYSGQIMLGLYTLGAGSMLTHGIEGYKADKAAGKNLMEAKGTIAYGVASLTVKALSFLTTERAHDKNAPTDAQGIIGWFQEKPMRIFGYGSFLTDSIMGLRTYGKYRKGKDQAAIDHIPQKGWKAFTDGYGLSAVTTGSYLLSDLVISSSNKDAANAVGKLNGAEQAKIETMMAETIARQPESQQERLAGEAAAFLEQEGMAKGSGEQLRSSLLSKAKSLSQKPSSWAESQHVTEKQEITRA